MLPSNSNTTDPPSGYLRYVGPVEGKPGTFAGVELVGENASVLGKNSGDVDGIRYFRTLHPHTGLFVPYLKLMGANLTSRTPVRTTRTNSVKSKSDHSSPLSASSSIRSTPKSTSDQDNLQKINSELNAQIVQLQLSLSKYEHELTARDASLLDLQKSLSELERELDSRDKRLLKLRQNHDRQRDELRDAIVTLEAQLKENARLFSMEIDNYKKLSHRQLKSLSPACDCGGRHAEYAKKTSGELLLFKTEIIELYETVASKDQEIVSLKKALAQVNTVTNQESTLSEDEINKLKVKLQEKDREIADLRHQLQISKQENTQKALQSDQSHLENETIDSLTKRVSEFEFETNLRSLRDITNSRKPSVPMGTSPQQKKLGLVNSVAASSTLVSPQMTSRKASETSAARAHEKPVTQVIDGELLVYIPESKLDPSLGRALWCALCERQGHNAVDCEYF